MKAIYVPLPDGVADQLRDLARREMRDPREQATWLILEGLRRAGLPVKQGDPEHLPLERGVVDE